MFLTLLFLSLIVSVTTPSVGMCVAVIGALLAMYLEKEKHGLGIFFSGVVTPLFSLFGSGTLLLFFLIFLAFRKERVHFWKLGRAWFYLALIVFWVVAELICGIFYFRDWLDHITTTPPHVIFSFVEAIRFFLFIGLCHLFSESEYKREQFFRGLVRGLTISAFIVLVQLCLPQIRHLFINQNTFWSSIGRYAGTFSDPNAFGVFVGLAFAPLLCFAQRNRPVRFLMLLWIVLGAFSGFCSFFIALFLYVAAWLFFYSKKFFCASLCCLLLFCGGVKYFASSDPDRFLRVVDTLPSRLSRVAKIFSSDGVSEALNSRIVFWKIDWKMLTESPFGGFGILSGIGFNQFERFLPYYGAKEGLGSWSDNPNSFYLSVLAETGVLGVLFFLLLCSAWEVRKEDLVKDPFTETVFQKERCTKILKVSVLVLAILLIFGSHLDFDEVAVFAAALCGSVFIVKNKGKRKQLKIVICSVLLTVVAVFYIVQNYSYTLVQTLLLDTGVFAFETDGQHTFRWSGKKAVFSVPVSDDEDSQKVRFRALHPDITTNPVEVCVVGKSKKCLSVLDSAFHEIELPCEKLPFKLSGQEICEYFLSVSRTWTPKEYGVGADSRALGIQIFNLKKDTHF